MLALKLLAHNRQVLCATDKERGNRARRCNGSLRAEGRAAPHGLAAALRERTCCDGKASKPLHAGRVLHCLTFDLSGMARYAGAYPLEGRVRLSSLLRCQQLTKTRSRTLFLNSSYVKSMLLVLYDSSIVCRSDFVKEPSNLSSNWSPRQKNSVLLCKKSRNFAASR